MGPRVKKRKNNNIKKKYNNKYSKKTGRPRVYWKKRDKIMIYLEKSVKNDLKALCFVQGKTISGLVNDLINEEIQSKKVIGLDKTTRIFSGPVLLDNQVQTTR